jgi:hypothetical protein
LLQVLFLLSKRIQGEPSGAKLASSNRAPPPFAFALPRFACAARLQHKRLLHL